MGKITVADFRPGLSTQENRELVRSWAWEAYSAWAMHHATIRRWLPGGFA
jgi:hypothetical protein